MSSVLKKELRQLRVAIPGYVFIAFILAVIGLYFSYTNLNLASGQFEAALRNVRFVFVVFIPLFTMRSLAEERRAKTDQLLFTLPLSDTQIVLGKYFAMVCVFALPVLVIALYPLILLRYGQVNLAAAWLSVVGFFLMGCACIAIGEFTSSLTENPVVAALASFGILLLCYLMDTISKMVPGSAKGSLTAFAVTGIVLGILLYTLTRWWGAGVLCLSLCAGIPSVIYLVNRPALEGSFQKVLDVFYLNGRLVGLSEGILDIGAIVYYLTVAGVFVFLTVQVLQLRRSDTGMPLFGKKPEERNAHRSVMALPQSHNGLYCICMTILVVASCVLLNRIILRLPADLSQPDFTDTKLYTLSDASVDWLHGLDREASLYLICESGQEDDTVEKLLRRYADESSDLTVRQIDPAVYPGFVSQYTDERVENNSIIAVCREKSRVVPARDLYTWGMSQATGRTIATSFDGEGLITGALAYVTSDTQPVLYVLGANGERALEGDFLETVQRANIEVRSLNLLTEEAVPEDAGAILLAAPSRDYSAEETEKILSYLERGGHGILLTDFSMEEMPYLDSILADYGLERVQGIILEGDSSRYISYPYCLIPEVNYSSLTAKFFTDTYLLLPMTQGLTITDTHRASVSFQPLLTTTAASYSKTDVQNMTTAEKEPGDIDGPFTVGMLVTEDINQDQAADTYLAVFSTGYLLDADYNQSVSGANAELMGEVIAQLCRTQEGVSAIPARNLQPEQLAITDFAANTWAGICTFLLPALVLAAGVFVWMRRRNR